MHTKAEDFRARAQRSAPPKPKQKKHPRRSPPADTSKPGVGADARRAGGGSSAARSRKKKPRTTGIVVLEDSAGKPSRKSTRRSANHSRPSSNLERKERRKRRTPSFRADAAQARTAKVGGSGKR